MGIKSIALAASTLVLSTSANAALITHGALSTYDDGSTNIITDTLNNYEWLRFDVVPQMTYTQLSSVLGTLEGGGWSIANTSVATRYLNALFSDNGLSCTLLLNGTSSCGTVNGWGDGDFGGTYNSSWDNFMFTNLAGGAGVYQIDSNGSVYFTEQWDSIAQADAITSLPANELFTRWAVYREIQPVPVPAAVWLFGSGLIGLIGIARRKKS